jgi:hypothetical protein
MAFSALLAADLAVRSIMRGYRFSRCIKLTEKETTTLVP